MKNHSSKRKRSISRSSSRNHRNDRRKTTKGRKKSLSPSYSSSFYSEDEKMKNKYRSVSSSSSAQHKRKRGLKKKDKGKESRKHCQVKSKDIKFEEEKVNLEISLEKEKKEDNYDSDTTQVNLKLGVSSNIEMSENAVGELLPIKTNLELKDEEVVSNFDKLTGEEETKDNQQSNEVDMSQGLVLRSKFLAESSTNDNYGAVEVYSSFKKLNIADFPNMHRKLVIFNLPTNCNEDEIKQYFLTLLTTLNPNMKLVNPILSLQKIQAEHGIFYIFELATKDDIEILKALNNTEWRGHRIRIEKPTIFIREYNNTKGKIIEVKEIKRTPNYMMDTDNKLYIGGIPQTAKESDIREIVEAFGQLKSFNLVKDPNDDNLNRGFCFFEYVDEKVTERAIKGLHNREMGEKRLRVQRATVNSKSFSILQELKANPVQLLPREAGQSNFSDNCPNSKPMINISIPSYALTPSRVLQLINILTIEDVMDDMEWREIAEDIRSECTQFGTVLNVEVPRPDRTSELAGPAVGKVFIKFSTLQSAKKARYNLSGRIYNRRTVISSFYPENYFDVREFNYHG